MNEAGAGTLRPSPTSPKSAEIRGDEPVESGGESNADFF